MFKKLFIGLAPLLAIAPFAAMPVAAQAVTQHWYQNGVLATAGEEIPFVTFGGEINLSPGGSGLGEVNCRTVGGGTIENPPGNGSGIGSLDALAFYECKGPLCEKEILNKFGHLGREWIEAKNMPAAINGHAERRFAPWFMQLEESVVEGVNSVRLKIGEPFVKFETPSPPGMIRTHAVCEEPLAELVGVEAISEGELKPEIGVAKTGNLNGTSAGAPSQMKFGIGTGVLHSKTTGEVQWGGNLKYLGYNHQELITVKP
jgi:hypothetical protein